MPLSLVQPCTIVKRVFDEKVFAAMDNFVWAALAMPLHAVRAGDEVWWKWQNAPLEFLYVYDSADWVVLTYEEVRLPGHGLVMRQTCSRWGAPLMVHTLREGHHKCFGLPAPLSD